MFGYYHSAATTVREEAGALLRWPLVDHRRLVG